MTYIWCLKLIVLTGQLGEAMLELVSIIVSYHSFMVPKLIIHVESLVIGKSTFAFTYDEFIDHFVTTLIFWIICLSFPFFLLSKWKHHLLSYPLPNNQVHHLLAYLLQRNQVCHLLAYSLSSNQLHHLLYFVRDFNHTFLSSYKVHVI